MAVRSEVRGVSISAQKVRLVADSVRGKAIGLALDLLSMSARKKIGMVLKKAIESAVANAEHNHSYDIDALKVKEIYVGQGPTLRRFSARAKGRGNRISKRTCNIFVSVDL
jgi:large subunit ribosomal protein L22